MPEEFLVWEVERMRVPFAEIRKQKGHLPSLFRDGWVEFKYSSKNGNFPQCLGGRNVASG